jgi:hypothetical protein
LDGLFESAIGQDLVFKGGTSLSKAYGAIRRFSEDIDLTYDIRKLIPVLVGTEGPALPKTRSEEKRWTSAVRKVLPKWIETNVAPLLQERLAAAGLSPRIRQEGDKLYIAYDPLVEGYGYVLPRVMLEFGARSTGEPNEWHHLTCDASGHAGELEFPSARAQVLAAERTFWEKSTAVHVHCSEGKLRGERISRHWHDLARLDEAGIAARALADRDLGAAVARHKTWFFAEKDSSGQIIDYGKAVTGGLRLVPSGAAMDDIRADYARMVEDGLLLDDAEEFEVLMGKIVDLERRANA